MKIPVPSQLCERSDMSATRLTVIRCGHRAWHRRPGRPGRTLKRELQRLVALAAFIVGSAQAQPTNGTTSPTNEAVPPTNGVAQTTNTVAALTHAPANEARETTQVEAPSQGISEPSFRIIGDRNIFNANRSGGTVRLSSRRPSRVESFTLVGTMAYEKGVFAFFEGSSSELTKVLKLEGVIAGHKLVDIFANSVKFEADGKEIELAVGSQLRREDEGAWQLSEARAGGYAAVSNGNGVASGRSGRSDRDRGSSSGGGSASESPGAAPAPAVASGGNQDEVLKRLMERREKESQ